MCQVRTDLRCCVRREFKDLGGSGTVDERMRGANTQDSSRHLFRLAPVISLVAAMGTLVRFDRDVAFSAFALAFPRVSQFDGLP